MSLDDHYSKLIISVYIWRKINVEVEQKIHTLISYKLFCLHNFFLRSWSLNSLWKMFVLYAYETRSLTLTETTWGNVIWKENVWLIIWTQEKWKCRMRDFHNQKVCGFHHSCNAVWSDLINLGVWVGDNEL